MKKILILGGSHRDIPLIKASQKLGYFVITLGDRDYYLGHLYSDKSYKINFNDLEAVKNIVETEKIDFLLPGCGEESYLKTVELAHELKLGNFDSLETAQLLHNKWRFKKFCLENSISTPKGNFYTKELDLKTLQFPLVVKPTNLSGGRGVEIVHNLEELHLSLNKSQKVSDEIFLEEYIEGKLIAYSIFLENQKIIYGFAGEDKTYLNPYLIASAYPTTIKDTTLLKLKNDIEKMAQVLALVNGMFHLQVLIQNDIPYIIDITRRIPGDLYPYLIEYCDGVEYSKAVVKAYTTGQIDDEFKCKNEKQRFIIRHCVMASKNGIYQKLHIDQSLEDKILYNFHLIEPNNIIFNFLRELIAIVFIEVDLENKNIIEDINTLIYPVVVA